MGSVLSEKKSFFLAMTDMVVLFSEDLDSFAVFRTLDADTPWLCLPKSSTTTTLPPSKAFSRIAEQFLGIKKSDPIGYILHGCLSIDSNHRVIVAIALNESILKNTKQVLSCGWIHAGCSCASVPDVYFCHIARRNLLEARIYLNLPVRVWSVFLDDKSMETYDHVNEYCNDNPHLMLLSSHVVDGGFVLELC